MKAAWIHSGRILIANEPSPRFNDGVRFWDIQALRSGYRVGLSLSFFFLCAPLFAQSGDEDEVPAVRFDPVEVNLHGWTILAEPSMLEGAHAIEGKKALRMLENHLERIAILVPPEPLKALRKVRIWIEHDHPRIGGMSYHPSKRWLVTNRHDPRLAKTVHIARAAQLLSRQQMLKHPAVILHELAHAYHDQVLSFDHSKVIEVFEAAKSSERYESVLLYTGKRVRHYGLNNHKEYFAEGTEAYFYRNDFFPFVRAELKEFDPALHELLLSIWGAAE